MTADEQARMAELERRVAELERFVAAMKNLRGPNGETLTLTGTNARLGT
jgi:hypothetical protein